MPSARRKNSRRLRGPRPDAEQARAARALDKELRRKLDESWAEYGRELSRLKLRTAQKRRELDDEHLEKVRKIGGEYDKERRRLERENDERRERILRSHVTEAA